MLQEVVAIESDHACQETFFSDRENLGGNSLLLASYIGVNTGRGLPLFVVIVTAWMWYDCT